MPVTTSSVFDLKSPTSLRPGESGLRLKDDPYYGKVDIGPAEADTKDAKTSDFEKKERARISQLPADERTAAEEKLAKELAKKRLASGKSDFDPNDPLTMTPAGTTPEKLAQLELVEEAIGDGTHALSGDEQSHIEVLTGKRLQQRPPNDNAATPVREPEDVGEGVEGEEGEREASRGNAMEPPERDRDKTKAAKPGESAKSDPVKGESKGEHKS